jgi:hypothetical protein
MKAKNQATTDPGPKRHLGDTFSIHIHDTIFFPSFLFFISLYLSPNDLRSGVWNGGKEGEGERGLTYHFNMPLTLFLTPFFLSFPPPIP